MPHTLPYFMFLCMVKGLNRAFGASVKKNVNRKTMPQLEQTFRTHHHSVEVGDASSPRRPVRVDHQHLGASRVELNTRIRWVEWTATGSIIAPTVFRDKIPNAGKRAGRRGAARCGSNVGGRRGGGGGYQRNNEMPQTQGLCALSNRGREREASSSMYL